MKHLKIYFLIIFLVVISCKKEDNRTELEKFLTKKNIEVPLLNGEWEWLIDMGKNSMGGPLSRVYTPYTEGYTKSVVFGSDRKFKEYKDSTLLVETYYRIEQMEYNDKFDMYTYKIYYFENKETQELQVDLSGEGIRLNLFNDCIDCIDTHIYFKK
jgi:hypothetical protein